MTTNLSAVWQALSEADNYLTVFGECRGTPEAQKTHVKKVYRSLAQSVHPDRNPEADHQLASQVFASLQAHRNAALKAVDSGQYGREPEHLVTTKRYTHRVAKKIASGDIADVMKAASTNKTGVSSATIFKVARSQRDADLMRAEASALRRLSKGSTYDDFSPYFPQLLESLQLVSDGRRRQANVMSFTPGLVSLAQVSKAFPGGVNPLDMAWMWRRMLYALGYVRDQGLVHGAAIPDHVLIQPDQHGLVLVDWAYSVASDGGSFPALKAVPPTYKGWYPDSTLRKKPPSFGLDTSMAARTFVQLLGGDPQNFKLPATVPRRFRAYLRGVLSDAESHRPTHAFVLLGEFDELLKDMGAPYYPRKFREFTMPTGW